MQFDRDARCPAVKESGGRRGIDGPHHGELDRPQTRLLCVHGSLGGAKSTQNFADRFERRQW